MVKCHFARTKIVKLEMLNHFVGISTIVSPAESVTDEQSDTFVVLP